MLTKKPVKVVIIDDQAIIRKDIKVLIQSHTNFTIAGEAGTVREAQALIPVVKPDLLLLDISLPDGTGFDILQEQYNHSFRVIFLTAYQQYAIRAIKCGAFDYLLKPIDQQELSRALNRLLDIHLLQREQVRVAQDYYSDQGHHHHIVLCSQDYLQVVELKDIMYCHSDKGYTVFYLSDGRKILTSRYLKEYEDMLPDSMFLRPHQSYLVNSLFIDKYQKDGFLVLKNCVEIPVASRRKEAILEFFNKLKL